MHKKETHADKANNDLSYFLKHFGANFPNGRRCQVYFTFAWKQENNRLDVSYKIPLLIA